ncbi:DJ-1/PfpI family protein [Bacillus sp. C1]
MKVCIVCFDEFTDIDVFLPWDLLNRVRIVGRVKDWKVKIVGTKAVHTSVAGLTIPMSGTIEDMKDADAVIFASGSGVQRLIRDSNYLNGLQLNPDKQLIGSMCSGALILGALGLLTEKRATTYPTVMKQLSKYGVQVVEESFVNVGNISTAAGCLAAQDLVSWIIESLVGEDMVHKVLESVKPVGEALQIEKL